MNWGQAFSNWKQLGGWAGGHALAAGKAAWSTSTGRGAIIGAGSGALYGAMSSNTSILGGMMMGAGVGAGAGRYGGAGWSHANMQVANYAAHGASMGLKGFGQNFGRGVVNMARADYKGARLTANQGFNTIKGLWH